MASASLLALFTMVTLGQTPQAEEPVRVGGRVTVPKKLKDVVPKYPEDAYRAGLEGMVVLECTVDTEGRVSDVKAVKGATPLVDAAVAAVKKWRYTPTLLDGRPVPVIMTVSTSFKHSRNVSLPDLVKSLSHENDDIREAAALTLARLGPQARDAIPALMKARMDTTERVRIAVDQAILRIRGE
jgi:TonB family protein